MQLTPKLIIFLILSTQVLTQTSNIQYITLNLQAIVVQKFPTYWLVNIPCESRVGQCKFQYTLLPGNWASQNNKIKVPLEDTEKILSFALNADIYDPTGEKTSKSFIVEFNNGEIKISEKTDYYTLHSYSEDQAPVKPLNLKVNSPPIQQPSRVIGNSQKTKEGFSIQNIANPLKGVPSLEEIESIILRGDIVEITKTIQLVITAQADCSAKIDYLNSVIGQLQNHIYHNKGRIAKGEVVMDTMKKQVKRLEGEMKEMKKQMQSNSKAPMQKKMKDLQQKREGLYKQYTLNEKISENYYQKMNEVRGQKNKVQSNETESQYKISVDELEIVKLNQLIADAQAKKKVIEDRIQMNKRIAEATKINKEDKEEQMEDLQNKFKEHNNIATQQKIRYRQTEYEMTVMKQKMEKAQRETDKMKQRMEVVEEEIKEQQSTIDQQQLKRNKILIQTLERSLPSVQKTVNTLYYQCNGIEETEIQEKNVTKAEIIFLVKPNAFTNYLYSTYGVNYINPSQQQNLRPVSIFSPQWSQLYGVPYPGFGTTIRSATRSFVCASGSNILSGYGIVESISRGIILVIGDDGSRYTLNLGICSRLQNTKGDFPHQGQQIFWRGKLLAFNTINLYLGTFY